METNQESKDKSFDNEPIPNKLAEEGHKLFCES